MKATFDPQVWVNDYAMSVDPLGPTEWDCTQYATENAAYIKALRDDPYCRPGDLLDANDVFINDPNAPDWVQEWPGPFSIWLTEEKEN
jgi:hypothetical protein